MRFENNKQIMVSMTNMNIKYQYKCGIWIAYNSLLLLLFLVWVFVSFVDDVSSIRFDSISGKHLQVALVKFLRLSGAKAAALEEHIREKAFIVDEQWVGHFHGGADYSLQKYPNTNSGR